MRRVMTAMTIGAALAAATSAPAPVEAQTPAQRQQQQQQQPQPQPAQPQPPAQEPEPVPGTETDPLLPADGACRHEDNVDAHHRLQRLAMHCLLDATRRQAGLRRLSGSVYLRHSATYKARRIADCKVFSHYPCGDRFASSFDRAGLSRRGRWLVGENLAYGVGPESTPREILVRWLKSPTHRSVLEDERFTHAGLRRRRLRMKGAPVGSVIWVLHVGVRRGT